MDKFNSISGYAFITGAASGIGKATVLGYAKAGISGICLVDINEAGLAAIDNESKAVATNTEYRCFSVTADAGKEEQINAAVERACEEFGRIDYAINSAGIGPNGFRPFSETETADYDRLSLINGRGMFFALRAELQKMKLQEPHEMVPGRPKQRGVVVNVASAAAIVAIPGVVSYNSSKHVVVGLTATAAADHAVDLIRVNSVAPGFIDTPFLSVMSPEVRNVMEQGALMKRLGQAEEIADAILFLGSPSSSFMTGQTLVLDGGYTVV